MADGLDIDEVKLEQALKEANSPSSNLKTNSQVWHIWGESAKGCFQWLVREDGTIIDCPYHLRGYWIDRQVDMDKLLDHKSPKLFVTCAVSGHLDEIRTTSLKVEQSDENLLPDYAYDTAYIGGLYDLTDR